MGLRKNPMDQSVLQPCLFIPHGGGPWPFIKTAIGPPGMWDGLRDYLTSLADTLPLRPNAVLVISSHWETAAPTVLTDPAPKLLFDYHGFPPETYQLSYPAPGAPDLAARVRALLRDGGVTSDELNDRGLDHGVFVPFMLIYPQADMPILAMSVQRRSSVDTHLAIGRALAPLRSEGVLIVGSGMSFHNLAAFFSPTPAASGPAHAFDDWLTETVEHEDPDVRNARLKDWKSAPGATHSHPTAEHLEPLFIVAGAAHRNQGRRVFHDELAGKPISAYQFG